MFSDPNPITIRNRTKILDSHVARKWIEVQADDYLSKVFSSSVYRRAWPTHSNKRYFSRMKDNHS